MQKTRYALLARGFDAGTADGLIAKGWTLGRLQQCQDAELRGLELSEELLNALRTGARPPIPIITLTKLLFDNRFLCCVCRDTKKSIVIHHIIDWAISHSHESSNLAVLCLDHHSTAHTTGRLIQNLDDMTLRRLKAEWEESVRSFDAQAILASAQLEIQILELFEGGATPKFWQSSNSARKRLLDLVGRGDRLPLELLAQLAGLDSLDAMEGHTLVHQGLDVLDRLGIETGV